MDSMQTAKGIFTTIKVINTIPFFLEKHLLRLGMENKKDFFKTQIKKILSKNGLKTSAIKISITEHGNILFQIRSLPRSDLVSAITIQCNQKLPTVKQINRSIYIKAKKVAKKSHGEEAIFVSKNNLLETTIANLILEDKNGNLVTPKLTNQGLKGITRQLLLDKGYIKEKNISINTKGPIVAINSLRVFGIEKLNNKYLNNPQALIKKVQDILKKEEEDYANSYYR